MSREDYQDSGLLTVGRIHGAFGVRGWLRVESFTEVELDLLTYQPWLVSGREYTVAEGKPHGKGLVVRLTGMDDRNAAELMRGLDIKVPSESLPELEDDEIYWRDLIGMTVINEDGVNLGTIESMMETGANDVMVLGGERERLLPWTDETVTQIRRDDRVVEVVWDPEF